MIDEYGKYPSVGPPAAASNKLTVALLLASLLLPGIVYVALQFGFGYRAERRALETAMIAKADAIMAEIDGNMQRTRASALALASASSVKREDWPSAYSRALELRSFNYDWKNIRLVDVGRGEEIFSLDRPYGARRKFRIPPITIGRLRSEALLFGGISRRGSGCPCVLVDAPVRNGGTLSYVFVIVLSPQAFQNELLANAPAEDTSAVVDANGRFIARTKDYGARIGTPATHFVREAVEAGRRRGIYRAVTYEGLANYTAFSRSPVTGWSTHVGIPKAHLDAPRWWSNMASLVALTISAFLALALVWGFLRVLAAGRANQARREAGQRLEAVGLMTGGIAHDFNNMLAVVIGSLELVRRYRASGRQDIDGHVDAAMSGASRAADLTRRLLAFSRQQTLRPIALDLNALLNEMRTLLSRIVNEQIEVSFHLDPDIWPVFVDPAQLENGVINLAANARDAMPHGGRLMLGTRNVSLTETQAAPIGLAVGDYAVLSVEDSGEGMSEQTIARAFDPFFTTKEVGRGTGLGLSQIYGFVEQSKGRVFIRSELGRGTTVEVYLPRHGEVPVHRPSAGSGPCVDVGGSGEVILVVEDEAAVRRAHVDALRELGYSVFHASDGASALQMLAEMPTPALLFTDIVMPGMSGRELALEARGRIPGLKVLFTTGWERGAPAVAAGDSAGLIDVLNKPFTMNRLAQAVREALARYEHDTF